MLQTSDSRELAVGVCRRDIFFAASRVSGSDFVPLSMRGFERAGTHRLSYDEALQEFGGLCSCRKCRLVGFGPKPETAYS